MDLLWCLVFGLALGVGYCAFGDSHLSDSAVEDLDLKLSAIEERAGRAVKYNRKGYKNVTRIVGGMPITEPIPYQISLQVLAHTNWRHICGGSIMGASHVLTAAHCVDKLRAERLSVVAGTNTLKSGGVRHKVAVYVKHPMYSNKGFLINDLAIIKVTPPFQFNQKVASINLADSSGRLVENNYPVTLTGWGSTSQLNHVKTPDQLMILNYYTIPNTSCKSRGYPVTPNEICTYMAKYKGACVGDSGGPLVNRERNIQIGVVSYGSTTCASGLPDVFTRVSNFRQWMKKVVLTDIP